jgi:hypothetical protein
MREQVPTLHEGPKINIFQIKRADPALSAEFRFSPDSGMFLADPCEID